MVSGAPFQAGKLIPVSDLNKKTISHTENLSTEVKLPGSVWYNLVNNGAFLKDDIVAWNADEDGYVYLSMAKHTHDADTNQAGGSIKDILANNIGQFLLYCKPMGISPSDFYQEGTGGSTALDPTSGAIKMDTSTTANNWRGLRLMGVRPSFATYSVLQTKMQFTGLTSNQFCRWGMNLEPMNVSNDSDSKYGIESCSATNGNWFLVTADNSSRTQQDSLKPLLGGATVQSYRIENTPGVSVDFTYATDSAVSKTTNLPDEESPPPQNNIVNYGIKATVSSAAKQLYVWGLVVVADEDDDSWV